MEKGIQINSEKEGKLPNKKVSKIMGTKKQTIVMHKVPIQCKGRDLYAALELVGVKALGGRAWFEVDVYIDGRSNLQNSLWAVWYNHISKQLQEYTPRQVKCICKLRYGVPILRAENGEFRRVYNKYMLHMSYEEKLEFIYYVRVTSEFTKSQGCVYTETLQREYAQQGVVLEVL